MLVATFVFSLTTLTAYSSDDNDDGNTNLEAVNGNVDINKGDGVVNIGR